LKIQEAVAAIMNITIMNMAMTMNIIAVMMTITIMKAALNMNIPAVTMTITIMNMVMIHCMLAAAIKQPGIKRIFSGRGFIKTGSPG
jgi:hypothetical protein